MRFLTEVCHLDLDLDMVRNLAWIIPEVLITLRSVEAQIQSVYLEQFSSEKLLPGWVGGGWSSFEFKDQLKLSLSRSISNRIKSGS